MTYTRILSIDGGGIRGIIPGRILVAFEEKLKAKTNRPDARIADYFDLIAGTSTGGILTCAYLCPDAARKPRYTAAEAVDLYRERGDDIFDIPIWHRISSGFGLIDEKYPAEDLERALDEYLGSTLLSDLIGPCLITAYDIERRRAHFFTSREAKTRAEKDFYLRDVARATSAAPTFFEAARIKSRSDEDFPLVDGGVFANNPSLCAYAEARRFPSKPRAADMLILSLGTGQAKKPYAHRDAKDWGLAGWAKPVLDIMMSGVSETVDFQLKQIFQAVGKPAQYLRIDPLLGHASPDMDNASRENINELENVGALAAQHHDQDLDRFAGYLL